MMDMATAYPLSNFVGIDIADDTFPQIIRPANTEFVQENVLNGLPFEDASFDYVFMRFMALAFLKDDWARVVAELCRVVRPGGFIEMVELDMEGKRPGPESKNMFTRLSKGLQARGFDPVIARRIGKLLISAELMDVNKGFGSIPVHWGGKLGEAMADDVRCAMKGLMVGFFLADGWGGRRMFGMQ
ncbi:hypothetical protein BC938DRAFT_472970 [Jimgerdemannia flammicorona]|uniref:Methyltransferase type 11 domain-containing protein n=1 Tax=Jimgerdemannia flammicorona TaxID=994334 RepID=A0A433Q513_9FUNG|nr:hypothetical protein BC938DRAFT_472970 [Jimgerdemannia flammicorona]